MINLHGIKPIINCYELHMFDESKGLLLHLYLDIWTGLCYTTIDRYC